MKLFIGDEEINISRRELKDRFLNEGREGKVYQYNKQALKLYTDIYKGKKKLKEEDVLRLRKIKTNRILLPNNPIYDENKKFIGYSTDFKIEAPKERIGTIDIGTLIKELELIEEDIKMLSSCFVNLSDLNTGGLLMTQSNIFISDPGEYEFNIINDEKTVYNRNIEEINYYFICVVFDAYLKLTRIQKEILKEYFGSSSEYFTEKIKKEVKNPKQSTNNFFRNLVLKY